MNRTTALLLCAVLSQPMAYAAEITVPILSTDGANTPLGTVVFQDTSHGLLITPQIKTLLPGLHGFHIHQQADCSDSGQAAGGHLDPSQTNRHQGPYRSGHLGDLPALFVDTQGLATLPTLAPRLNTASLHQHAIMIHAGGDNYTDTPPLGGGGARLGCGIID